MTVPKALQVRIVLPVDPPRPLISDDPWRPEVLAAYVRWERTITEERDLASVSISTDEGRYCTYHAPFDTLPDWVPRPTESWHAIVSELAAEVLA